MLDSEPIARAELHPLRCATLEQLIASPPNGDPGWSSSTLAAGPADDGRLEHRGSML